MCKAMIILLLLVCGCQEQTESARRSVVADTSVSIAGQEPGMDRPTVLDSSWEKPDRRADILDTAWKAITFVESGNDPFAYNAEEDAAGIAQIRPILVKDVNRILGHKRFSLRDRYDVSKARAMFDIYQHHYCRSGTIQEMARSWCSGPRGMSKDCSLPYWRKVQKAMGGIRWAKR